MSRPSGPARQEWLHNPPRPVYQLPSPSIDTNFFFNAKFGSFLQTKCKAKLETFFEAEFGPFQQT